MTELQVLALALNNIYGRQKQAEEYIMILESRITEEGYEEATEEYEKGFMNYSRNPRKQPHIDTARQAKILLKALKRELGSDEIAEMLNLDVWEVESALQGHRRISE